MAKQKLLLSVLFMLLANYCYASHEGLGSFDLVNNIFARLIMLVLIFLVLRKKGLDFEHILSFEYIVIDVIFIAYLVFCYYHPFEGMIPYTFSAHFKSVFFNPKDILLLLSFLGVTFSLIATLKRTLTHKKSDEE